MDQNATIEFLLASVHHHNALLNNHNFPFTILRFCKHIQNEIYIRDNFKSIAIVHFQGSRNWIALEIVHSLQILRNFLLISLFLFICIINSNIHYSTMESQERVHLLPRIQQSALLSFIKTPHKKLKIINIFKLFPY